MRDQSAEHASYLRQAARAFRQATGLDLGEVRPGHERLPGALSVRRAMSEGVAPDGYVASVVARCGFQPAEAVDADVRNRSVSLLTVHVADNPDWVLSRSGAAYLVTDEGLFRVAARAGDDPFGFDVDLSREARLVLVNGVARADGGGFARLATEVDLDAAVAHASPRAAPAMR